MDRGREERVKGEGKGRGGTNWGRMRRGRETSPPVKISGYATGCYDMSYCCIYTGYTGNAREQNGVDRCCLH